MYTNVHSMGNKQEELEAIVQQESSDGVAIMEMWWSDLHGWSAAMSGYKLFRKDRQESGRANKADILVGVCYMPPNQDDEGDELFYKQLADVSKSPALVLVGDFNLPDICWELNTAKKRQPGDYRVYRG
ncbi:mitochondrial fission process protein 1 [Willisornis vidua]|uniref:Mitochondrial fission process protein 1 n=1 Tax=Willisornis vidua TaxID=1566151 RepID=A0ABQ9DBX0_9PASS|nr:mitochondrial fission process protein 1 [Willisornis vidua]